MIIGFCGKMGSGKTLSMVREIHKYYLRGYKVYSNFALEFDYESISFDDLFLWAEEQREMNNIVIALDEIHILLDSRSGMSGINKTMTFWLNQTRKMGVKLFYTTQYFHQIDKRLRSGTDVVVYCDGLKVIKNDTEYFLCCNEITDGENTRNDIFIGNDFYNLYNTLEVIKFVNKKKLKSDADERRKERAEL